MQLQAIAGNCRALQGHPRMISHCMVNGGVRASCMYCAAHSPISAFHKNIWISRVGRVRRNDCALCWGIRTTEQIAMNWGAFFLGWLCMDQVLYWEHRFSHCSHWLARVCRCLHVGRHHTVYPRGLDAAASDGLGIRRHGLMDCIPSIQDMDASAAIPVVVLATYTQCRGVFIRCMIQGAGSAMLVAFALHALAHSLPGYCPQWYLNFHSAHHKHRQFNFGVLSPLPDFMYRTMQW